VFHYGPVGLTLVGLPLSIENRSPRSFLPQAFTGARAVIYWSDVARNEMTDELPGSPIEVRILQAFAWPKLTAASSSKPPA
jgi:hypothetical protein